MVDAFDSLRCLSRGCRSSLGQLISDWVRDRVFAALNLLNSCSPAFDAHAQVYPERKECKTCKAESVKAIDGRRRELFKDLGKIIGISTWPAQA